MFQYGNGVPDAGVSVIEQGKTGIAFFRRQPGRIRDMLRIVGIHQGTRFRFADDDNDRIRVLCRIQLDCLEIGEFAGVVLGIKCRPFHIIMRIQEGADGKTFRKYFFSQGADGRQNDDQGQQWQYLTA